LHAVRRTYPRTKISFEESMIGSNVAVSGMNAAAKRLDVAAANIVNAHDTAPPRKEPVKPVGGSVAAEGHDDGLYRPRRVHQSSVESGGTRAHVVEKEPTRRTDYAPDEPMANDEGLVDRPNVDVAAELVDTILAQRAYEAAIKALQARDEVLGTTIDARS
jgi:flagellar basal-body rod protein FlgC